MRRKILIIGVALLTSVSLCGCSVIDKLTGKNKTSEGTKDVDIEKEETGGLYFKFGEEFDGSDYSIGDIVYQGPTFGNVIRADGDANAFVQTNDKQILFVWYDADGSVSSANEVFDNCGSDILAAVSTDAGFVAESAFFDVEAGEVENHNNIDRINVSGTISCFDEEKKEMSIPCEAYGFVANGKPGCVISVITATEDADKYQEEIEHNTLVLMNTVVVSQ